MDGAIASPTTIDPGPVRLTLPPDGVAPGRLVLASPHSGRDYPADFLAASRLDPQMLRQSEDSFVDELFADAPALGAPLLAATFPRAYCDANRERFELDPEMFVDRLPSWCTVASPRIAAGYGTIPRVVGGGERIHKRKLHFAEACARIDACWEPYHAALRRILDATRRREGRVLLLDCHSMPADKGSPPADFILGDNHGEACAPAIVSLVESTLAASGWRVRRNDPYAGGYVTRHYGRPTDGVHVLQLEISRHLYLDERRRERTDAFEPLRREFARLVALLAAAARELG